MAQALGLPEELVLVGSTGRIGVPLPIQNVRQGIAEAVPLLGSTTDHAAQASEAIMTSDTRSKQFAVEFKLDGRTVRLEDLTGPARYDREGTDLPTRGLYLDLPAWGYHVFDVRPALPSPAPRIHLSDGPG